MTPVVFNTGDRSKIGQYPWLVENPPSAGLKYWSLDLEDHAWVDDIFHLTILEAEANGCNTIVANERIVATLHNGPLQDRDKKYKAVDRVYRSPNLMKFYHREKIVGTKFHRAGWPMVMESFQRFEDPEGFFFDDFIDSTWHYRIGINKIDDMRPFLEPRYFSDTWFGVLHHPPCRDERIDEVFGQGLNRTAFQNEVFLEALETCGAIFCLSQYLADYVKEHTDVPTIVHLHPTEMDVMQWNPETYLSEQTKTLLSMGRFMRNWHIPFHIPPVFGYKKQRVLRKFGYHEQQGKWLDSFYNRPILDKDVEELEFMPNHQYDRYFSRCVVLTELVDASANNLIVECIARATPIVVNRNPAAVEYLGEDYPLFFDDPREVPELLHPDSVLSAHYHMKYSDRSWLDVDTFTDNIFRDCKALL